MSGGEILINTPNFKNSVQIPSISQDKGKGTEAKFKVPTPYSNQLVYFKYISHQRLKTAFIMEIVIYFVILQWEVIQTNHWKS